jgi:hypothetical protein
VFPDSMSDGPGPIHGNQPGFSERGRYCFRLPESRWTCSREVKEPCTCLVALWSVTPDRPLQGQSMAMSWRFNLFLVIGIHALHNAGTSIVVTPIDPALLILSLAVIVLLLTFVPAVSRRLRGIDASQSPEQTFDRSQQDSRGSRTGVITS